MVESGSAKIFSEVISELHGLRGSPERLRFQSESLNSSPNKSAMDILWRFREVDSPDCGSQCRSAKKIGAGDDVLEGDAVPRRAVQRDDDNATSRESSVSAEDEST